MDTAYVICKIAASPPKRTVYDTYFIRRLRCHLSARLKAFQIELLT